MAKFKGFFQRRVKPGSPAQLPPFRVEKHFIFLRRQFLYEKHLKAIEVEVDGYINMSQGELRERFSSYNQVMLNAHGLAEAIEEPNFEKRREYWLKRKESWTAKSPEEFDPAVCNSEAFDGFEEWLKERNKK